MRVHDSQAYRKVDVTRERISRVVELKEILLSIQTGFSLVNVSLSKTVTYLTVLHWCSGGSKLVADDSDCVRQAFLL